MTGPDVPEAFASIPLAGNLFAGGAGVTGTNLAIVLLLGLILLAGGAMFNEALEENGSVLSLSNIPVPSPVSSAFGAVRGAGLWVLALWAAIIPGRTWMDTAAAPAILLLFTALIYGFLQPGFGFNQASLIVLLSLLASKWILTEVYSRGKVRALHQYSGIPSQIRLFPACIIIALVSVAVSRLGDIQPGFIIGFIAGVALLEHGNLRGEGKAYALIGAALLGLGVVAWLAAVPLHSLAQDNPTFWTRLAESVALAIFIVCIDGLMFSLIPLKFMDGAAIWAWSKRVWFLLFIPTAFLFVQVLFNDTDDYSQLFSHNRSFGALGLLALYAIVTFGTWAYFRRLAIREEHEHEQDAEAGSPAGGH